MELPNLHVKNAIKDTTKLKQLLDSTISFTQYQCGRSYASWHDGSNLTGPPFEEAMKIIAQYLECIKKGDAPRFTFVNRYEGSNWLDYHSDEEHESIFVTVSVGAARTLNFRNIKTKVIEASYRLEDGDLFFFDLATQETHEHGIDIESQASLRYSILAPFDCTEWKMKRAEISRV